MEILKSYIRDIMYGKRNVFLSRAVKPFLLIASYVYGFFAAAHNFFYKVNLLKSYKSGITTISVGNITLGGTGKTPFVMMLAEKLIVKGKKTAILIRGYGEDEWGMLEEKLGKRGVRVFVGKDRIKSAGAAEKSGMDVLILDDGFQHRRLKRDVDIALLDSTNPFGNRHLFPRGILREPIKNLNRTDVIVLTKADKGKESIEAIKRNLKNIIPGKPILEAEHRPVQLFEIYKENTFEMTFIKGKIVSALSGICDGAYFKYTLEKIGAQVALEFVFPDHHLYRASELARIFRECKKKNIDTIITTEKDAVKLKKLKPEKSTPQIFALSVKLELIRGKEEIDAILA